MQSNLGYASLRCAPSELMNNNPLYLQEDTIKKGGYTKNGEWNELLDPSLNDSISRRNLVPASSIDALDYKLDKRDKGFNEDFKTHWYDNMFLQFGAGPEQIVPFSKNYQFEMLTTAHLGLGVQLGRYNSFRLKAHGAMGYQKYYDRVYARLGGQLEHLYDLSSALDGYQPTRMLGFSTILGVGGQTAKLNNYKGEFDNAIEGHVGLQLRFYTGPHGYLNIEPYVGIASDRYDLNYENNWRGFDTFYGVNINYTYYFTNHLSRQARIRQIEEAKKGGKDDWVQYYKVKMFDPTSKTYIFGPDSILQSWQTPWFYEFAFGPNFTPVDGSSITETMGSSAHLSVGKWFSPIIGLRFSASARSGTWLNETITSDGVDYVKKQNMQYFSAGFDALFNPLGFLKDKFTWDAPYGAYLLAGGEFGWLKRDENGAYLHCRSEAYSAGLHLWYRLSEGTQIFVEPRFTHHVYKIPYRNANWNRRFSDNSYGIRIGLTAQSVARKFWSEDTTTTTDKWRPLTVSLGIGTNVVQKHEVISTSNNTMPYNLNASVAYHFGKLSGVRLGLQYISLPASENTRFIDYNMTVPEFGYAPVKRQGVWHHNYYLGTASLAYVLNMTNAMAGYRPGRLFELEAFLGPSIAYTFGETGSLDERISLMEGHEARVAKKIKQKLYPAVSGGAILSARLSQRMGVTFTPQIHLIPTLTLPTLLEGYPRFIETFDLGVYYKF